MLVFVSDKIFLNGEEMKKSVLTGVAALTLFDVAASATASAQNSNIPDVFLGTYAGIHGGYRWGEAEFTSAPYTIPSPGSGASVTFPGRNDEFSPDGGIIGLHLGHSKALQSNWIAGVEGDITWGSGDDGVSLSGVVSNVGGDAFAYTIRSEVEFNWQATLRARIGRVSGDWMYYATGGIAFLDVDWKENMTLTGVGIPGGSVSFAHNDSDIQVGFVVGGGVEKAINDKWTARGEYLYENFGSFSVRHGASTPPQVGNLGDIDAHKLRFGLTRKIGG